MQFVCHLFGVCEFCRVKAPVPKGTLPAVVNDQLTGRHTAVQNRLGIVHNALLGLVVLKLDPGAILGNAEH